MTDPITLREFQDSPDVEDWRLLSEGACAFFRTGSFAAGARLAQAIGELPEIQGHHAQIDIRRDGVTVRLITIDADGYFGMSRRDANLARQISTIAREQGAPADPSLVQTLLVVPGAPDPAAVMPFWRAILGYEPRIDSPDEDLVDPRELGAPFWFERMNEPRADGGGAIHLAVWLPPELAEARLAAALAAGGRLVRDQFAPAWWTLADAAGNEVDISTIQGRE